ncbi:MAG: Maf family nucleotide pyrophosphatase, partial [candidate division WOR-3 bacterium]
MSTPIISINELKRQLEIKKLPLYLASQSPRRKELLKRLNLPFTTIVPLINENLSIMNPIQYVLTVAKMKVNAVADEVSQGVIIGVDTIVVIDDKILTKPKNYQDALAILKLLSGRKHSVYSGLCLLVKPNNQMVRAWDKTDVWFRKLSLSEINLYLKSQEGFDKAG